MASDSRPLGKYLKERRIAAELSQQTVAKALGYSCSQMISNWERGLCHPPLAKLGKVASLYRIKSTELISIMIRDYEKTLNTNLKAG